MLLLWFSFTSHHFPDPLSLWPLHYDSLLSPFTPFHCPLEGFSFLFGLLSKLCPSELSVLASLL